MIEKKGSSVNTLFRYIDKIFNARPEKGKTLLQVTHSNNAPPEGACEGSLACTTRHITCDDSVFREEEFTDRENDLLVLAYGPKPISRLG